MENRSGGRVSSRIPRAPRWPLLPDISVCFAIDAKDIGGLCCSVVILRVPRAPIMEFIGSLELRRSSPSSSLENTLSLEEAQRVLLPLLSAYCCHSVVVRKRMDVERSEPEAANSVARTTVKAVHRNLRSTPHRRADHVA